MQLSELLASHFHWEFLKKYLNLEFLLQRKEWNVIRMGHIRLQMADRFCLGLWAPSVLQTLSGPRARPQVEEKHKGLVLGQLHSLRIQFYLMHLCFEESCAPHIEWHIFG